MPPVNLIFSSDVTAKAQAGHSKETRLTTSATLMGCSQMPSSLNGTGRPESICHKRTHPARLGISAQRPAVFFSGRQLQQFLEMCIERHAALGGKGLSFSRDVDSTVFSVNSSTRSAQPPFSLSGSIHLSVRPLTATVEIHGTDSATCTMLCFALFLFFF